MENLRGLLGIRRIDRVRNAWINELCRVTKRVDKRIGESVLCWFSHIERIENDRIDKRVCVGDCMGSRLIGQPRESI